jgi:hypothetical protein
MAEQLRRRIEGLPLGGVELLTKAQFQQEFADQVTLPEMKEAAIALGERYSCRVLFFGQEHAFVSFTRTHTRSE